MVLLAIFVAVLAIVVALVAFELDLEFLGWVGIMAAIVALILT